ncbi:glucosamine-6-phosphate deaminase [Oceanobacillus sojae]|uniref:glucosamine-6-phosphate deaminase n=1 Tax=Oceanobacillus sojae TaxID=582851 RepID=UPI0021A2A54D|nr:glucosamine-6-phosphate deaminase [Oceanobacillus sojae]MCT1901996.1 glucosamine-6-phosphate deaminase [Oceanobacillus sojae]
MKIIVGKNLEEMSTIAAQHVLSYMYQDRRVNLAITGGTTPEKMYEILVPQVKNQTCFSNVHYYNFDEIPYKKEDREGVTISDLRRYYLDPANIAEENIHALNQYNYKEQDQRIKNDGGLDMIILGIGADGHYCGNLPGTTSFGDMTTRVECDQRLKDRILPEFNYEEEHVPDYYITMGPKSIMMAKNLVLIASGTKKAEIIQRILQGKVEESIPASILTMHPNLTIILDEEAASLINYK